MFKNYKSLLAIVLLFFTLQQVNAQSVKISGVVTAKSDGQPLPGVSIGVKGTTTGTQTDFQGKFTIPANANDILRISVISASTLWRFPLTIAVNH
jgi:hypothetical protein